MSLIDALETENKQALGTLEAVVAQRDRLLRYVRAELRMHRSLVERCDPWREMAIDAEYNAARQALIDHGDLSEPETAVRAHRRRAQG